MDLEGPVLLGDARRVAEDDRGQRVLGGKDVGVRLFPDPVPQSHVDSAELHETIIGEPASFPIIVGCLENHDVQTMSNYYQVYMRC